MLVTGESVNGNAFSTSFPTSRSKGLAQSEDLLPPLPTAAAHHPQHMAAFSSPVTPTSSVTVDRRLSQISDCGQARISTTPRANVLITKRLAAEEQTNLALNEALNRMRTMREGLQAELELIPPADGAGARAQSRRPSDVSIPPASSKDVTTDTLTREQAVRPPVQNQVIRTGKGSTVHLAAFPLPKVSNNRNHPTRPRVAAVPAIGPTQPTRRLRLDNAKQGSSKTTRPAEPRTTNFVQKSSGADSSEAVTKVSSGNHLDHQSPGGARLITTTTQERQAIVCLFTRSLLKRIA